MTRSVFKYPIFHRLQLALPHGFMVRHVADQMGTTCLWAEVDPKAPTVLYRIHRIGTGDDVPEGGVVYYLGTTLEAYGQYVWHYYAEQMEPLP